MKSIFNYSKYICKRVIWKLKTRVNKLAFYSWNSDENSICESDDETFRVISSWDEYRELFVDCPDKTGDYYKKRFDQNWEFAYIKGDLEVLAYGWRACGGRRFSIDEIDLYIQFGKDVCVLFDFYTYEKHRGRGYCTKLIKSYLTHNKNKTVLMYAYTDNIFSLKSIEKSGFSFIGVYNHFSKKLRRVLIDMHYYPLN